MSTQTYRLRDYLDGLDDVESRKRVALHHLLGPVRDRLRDMLAEVDACYEALDAVWDWEE